MLPLLSRRLSAGNLLRSTAIALVAAAMPFAIDIDIDVNGAISFGAPRVQAQQATADGSGASAGGSSSGGSGGSSSTGGGASGAGNSGGGSGGGGSAGEGSDRDENALPGSLPTAPKTPATSTTVFQGSSEPDGRDLTESEEQDLISRGWQ